MAENTLLKQNKDLIYILIIFALLTISVISLFGGWKHINHLQEERRVLKDQNKEILKQKQDIDKILEERTTEFQKVEKQRQVLKVQIAKKEKQLKEIKEKYEKDIIDIANSDINDDIGKISDIFSDHSRR